MPTRRQLLTAGVLAASMPQQPALADSDEEISYVQGPQGLEYADVTVGKGESPFEGDGKEGIASVFSYLSLAARQFEIAILTGTFLWIHVVWQPMRNHSIPNQCEEESLVGPESSLRRVLKANYQLNVNGKKVDYAKFFVFSAGTGEVIKGWDMLVMGADDMAPMKVGGIRKARIPPALGYGAKGAGCRGDGDCAIPPDSTLEFTIELVGIK